MRQPFLQPQKPKNTLERQILTVSQLNKKAKSLIESNLGSMWIEGEISNFVNAASGHWYFTLKDNKAQIKCAIFKFKNRQVSFRPKEGDKVIVKGNVSLYEARGDYQLIGDYMEPAGLGKLQQELNLLVTKLDAEGLFSQANKKLIPALPKSIGVITSPTGAAIHDVLSVLERRCPMVPVTIYPTQVQGEAAVDSIIQSLKTAQIRSECDVLLMTRGGGSLEDLWCFNNEELAREITQSSIPIVAAIGHEVDVTITELVADLRAPTPSAAAELLVPEQQAMWQKVDLISQDLHALAQDKISQLQIRLNVAMLKLRDPERKILHARHQLSTIRNQLEILTHSKINSTKGQLNELIQQLNRFHPKERLLSQKHQLNLLNSRMQVAINKLLDNNSNRLKMAAAGLNTLSPLATLDRGYSITRNKEKAQLITKVSQVEVGKELNILLSDGEINCRVC